MSKLFCIWTYWQELSYRLCVCCGLMHNTYLYFPNQRTDEGITPPPSVPTVTHSPRGLSTPLENVPENPRMSNYTSSQGGKLVLPIVPARVRCIDTKAIIDTYAMLDPGNNATYCTEMSQLRSQRSTRRMDLTTIAQTRMPVESNVITLFVSDIYDTQEPCCISKVTVRPTFNMDLSGLSSCAELQKRRHLKLFNCQS